MEETNKTIKKEKVKKTLTELSAEGWTPTFASFAPHLKVYQNGNERLLYNSQEGTIEKKYTFDASK